MLCGGGTGLVVPNGGRRAPATADGGGSLS